MKTLSKTYPTIQDYCGFNITLIAFSEGFHRASVEGFELDYLLIKNVTLIAPRETKLSGMAKVLFLPELVVFHFKQGDKLIIKGGVLRREITEVFILAPSIKRHNS